VAKNIVKITEKIIVSTKQKTTYKIINPSKKKSFNPENGYLAASYDFIYFHSLIPYDNYINLISYAVLEFRVFKCFYNIKNQHTIKFIQLLTF